MLPIAPGEITRDATAPDQMGGIIAAAQAEFTQCAKVRFNGIEPGGIGWRGHNRDPIFAIESPQQAMAMGIQIVHNDVQTLFGRVTGAQSAKGGEQIAMRFPLSHLALQAIGVHIVKAQELFGAGGAPIVRPQPPRVALAGQHLAGEGSQLHGPMLIEADHDASFGGPAVEPHNALFFRSKFGSGEANQVLVRWGVTPSRRSSRRHHSSPMGGSQPWATQ